MRRLRWRSGTRLTTRYAPTLSLKLGEHGVCEWWVKDGVDCDTAHLQRMHRAQPSAKGESSASETH